MRALPPCRCGHPGMGCNCYDERLAEANERDAARTAATPPPPHDGEVLANEHRDANATAAYEASGRQYGRPAAPSEPPAEDPFQGLPLAGWPQPRLSTPPPAEAQQDDELVAIGSAILAALLASKQPPNSGTLCQELARAALAARPSADTETLRAAVSTWIDEAPEHTAGLDLLRQIIAPDRAALDAR